MEPERQWGPFLTWRLHCNVTAEVKGYTSASSPGRRVAADCVPCHPPSPPGSRAVTVNGRWRRRPDVTPAAALTQVLRRTPGFSATQHHLSPSAVSRVPDRRVGIGALCRILLQSCSMTVLRGLRRTKELPHEGTKPFQLVHLKTKQLSLFGSPSQIAHMSLIWTVGVCFFHFSLIYQNILEVKLYRNLQEKKKIFFFSRILQGIGWRGSIIYHRNYYDYRIFFIKGV